MAFDPLGDVFGGTPQVAFPTDVILSDEQKKALAADLAAWPDIANIGDLFQQSYLKQLEDVIPGFREILKMGGQTTEEMLKQSEMELKGQVPQDVIDQIQRSSAYTNLMSGGPGGANALSARDLGLTSLNLIQQGAQLAGQAGNAAQRWAGLSGAGQAAGIEQGMLITPMQQAEVTRQNNLLKQQAQQLQYNLEAAPSPVAKGISDTIINLIGAYLGAGKGGGGGGVAPNYSASQYAGEQAGMGFGGNFGGTNIYSATTGGYNFGGTNWGGQNIPYMGGPSDVTTPGYSF